MMKKILFVLFLGLSSGAFATSEMELVNIPSAQLDQNETPAWMIVIRNNGTVDVINDGGPCVEVWNEDSDGYSTYEGEICP